MQRNIINIGDLTFVYTKEDLDYVYDDNAWQWSLITSSGVTWTADKSFMAPGTLTTIFRE